MNALIPQQNRCGRFANRPDARRMNALIPQQNR
jgi:hypothetical protein